MDPMTQSPQQTGPKRSVRTWLTLAALPIAVIIGAGIFWMVGNNNPNTETRQAATSSDKTVEPVLVSLGDTGIRPAAVTVTKGQTVTWRNDDTKARQLTADKTALPGFDSVHALAKDETFSYTFEKTGTFSYYDAHDPAGFNATITVK